MLWHVVSAAHARTWEQQLCSPQVSHVVSVAEAVHVPPPPLLLPLPPPLLLALPHCEAQLFATQVIQLVAAESPDCWAAAWHAARVVQSCSATLTHVASAPQAVSWEQQLVFWQVSHEVSVAAAGHDPPPLDPPPELEQLPDDVEPLPRPPPIPPPPLDEPQLLLPPLEDEHPMTTAVAATIPKVTATEHVRTKRMTGFIGEVLPLALPANMAAYHARAPPTMRQTVISVAVQRGSYNVRKIGRP
jgi:hypothetical protein